ncbi:MAG: C39 family peptidase [Pirellulales bacterium]
MRNSAGRLMLCAAALVWLLPTLGSIAEEVDVQPQASPQQPGQQRQPAQSSGGNTDDNRNNDAEPQTVERQMQTLKRELRGQKADPSQTAPIRDGQHQFQLKVPNYVTLRQRNIVMQQRDFSCGAACLATICRYYWGDDVTEEMVLEPLDILLTAAETEDRIKNGLAMSDLRRAAVKMGYQSVVGTTTFAKLGEMKVPAIVGIQPSGHKHFVVLKGTFGDWVYLADPIRGNIRMPNWEFVKQWQKNAILVVYKPGEKVKKYSALSLTEADINLSDLSDQIIRSQEARQPQNRLRLSP